MAAEGATCVVNYPGPMEAEAANVLIRELKAKRVNAIAIAADVTDTGQVAKMFEEIKARFGHLDVVVTMRASTRSRAGGIGQRSIQRDPQGERHGGLQCCRAAVRIMREQKKGSILNIASVAAFIGRGNADYISSKAALLGLTRSLARQYGKFGIRANCVSPGFRNTEMTQRARQTSSESAADFIKAVPLGFLAESDSIGKAATFLATDEAYYITGQNLVVDGGLTLRRLGFLRGHDETNMPSQ
jgi:NAD(P)-dependent dehydrogenase (short-subunit alcohol dehydrogenase family)